MIRVAFVVHTFSMGGLERCVARLVNHLDRERFAPLVVCLGTRGDAEGWIRRPDVEVLELGKRDGNDVGAVRRFARVLRERRVDVVHSHNWGTLVETVLARRWAGVKRHVHAERGTVLGGIEARGLRYRLRRALMRWALRRTDAIVAVAQAVRQKVEDLCGFQAGWVRVVPNGVDAPECVDRRHARESLRLELGIADSALVAGSVARLHAVKGFTDAVDALKLVVDRGIDGHLVLVGDGPEKEAIERRVGELDLHGRVHLVGQRADVGACHATMDVYVNSSLSEGMSQAVLEAMASGLPLVVTDVGEHALVVGGQRPCGLVVPASQPSHLAKALERTAREPALRHELAAEARKRWLERYSVGTMVAAYEELYDSVLGPRPALAEEVRP